MKIIFCALVLSLTLNAQACTTVHVAVKPHSARIDSDADADASANVIGRTMELGHRALLPLWELVVVPRNSWKFCKFFTLSEEGLCHTTGSRCPFPPNTTRNAHGFVAINVPITLRRDSVGPVNVVLEGQNEQGLTISAQILQLSQYQAWDDSQCRTADGKYRISWLDFIPYLLGSFANAPDAIHALRNELVVTRPNILEFGFATGLHWAVDDRFGNHFIVEYLGNELVVQESKLGVFTNDPDFSWHVQNLNTYGNLQAEIPHIPKNRQFPLPSNMQPKQITTKVPFPKSHGSGLLGIPGDSSPPSRFVRMFYLRSLAQANEPPPDLKEALALTSSLLDSVAIPFGSVGPAARESNIHRGNTCDAHGFSLLQLLSGNELAQWTVLKIPSKSLMYYRNYVNSAWQKVDFNTLDFSECAQVQSVKLYNPNDAFGIPAQIRPQVNIA